MTRKDKSNRSKPPVRVYLITFVVVYVFGLVSGQWGFIWALFFSSALIFLSTQYNGFFKKFGIKSAVNLSMDAILLFKLPVEKAFTICLESKTLFRNATLKKSNQDTGEILLRFPNNKIGYDQFRFKITSLSKSKTRVQVTFIPDVKLLIGLSIENRKHMDTMIQYLLKFGEPENTESGNSDQHISEDLIDLNSPR